MQFREKCKGEAGTSLESRGGREDEARGRRCLDESHSSSANLKAMPRRPKRTEQLEQARTGPARRRAGPEGCSCTCRGSPAARLVVFSSREARGSILGNETASAVAALGDPRHWAPATALPYPLAASPGARAVSSGCARGYLTGGTKRDRGFSGGSRGTHANMRCRRRRSPAPTRRRRQPWRRRWFCKRNPKPPQFYK